MKDQHPSACGRRIALRLEQSGASRRDAVNAIHRHCNVSLLRAHRTAHGYTLVQVVDLMRQTLRQRGVNSSGLAHQTVSRWENGLDVPSRRYLDALCLVYRSRPDQLGFGHDYTPEESATEGAEELSLSTSASSTSLYSLLQHQPLSMNIEILEQRVEESGYELYTQSPAQFIPARMLDLAAIQGLLLRSPKSTVRKRLDRVAARNAGFIGIRLTDVAGADETFNWFNFARQAARRADDAGIEAWIAGHMCDGHACYGLSLTQGLKIAQVAQTANGTQPNPAALFGYLAEAGVQARLGCRRETLHAVRQAERIFESLPPKMIAADGVRIPEFFLRWHQSNALSVIGERRLADPLRARALELPLGQGDLIGRGLLFLDEAALLLQAGDVEQSGELIRDTWTNLPPELLGGQITSRTRGIVARIARTAPREARSLIDFVREQSTRAGA